MLIVPFVCYPGLLLLLFFFLNIRKIGRFASKLRDFFFLSENLGNRNVPIFWHFSTQKLELFRLNRNTWQVCIFHVMVRSDFYRFASDDASLLRGYPRYAHKYAQRAKLLWKTSIGRRQPIHSKEVWMHHKLSASNWLNFHQSKQSHGRLGLLRFNTVVWKLVTDLFLVHTTFWKKAKCYQIQQKHFST